MNPLLSQACDVLAARNATFAMQTVASECLITAQDLGFPLPVQAPDLLWEWLKQASETRERSTSFRLAIEFVGGAFSADRLREASELAVSREVPRCLRVLAYELLGCDGNAAHLSDEQLLALTSDPDPRLVRFQSLVLHMVNDSRPLPQDMARTIRDRWAASQVPRVRSAAASLAGHVPCMDLAFAARLLDDPDPEVRSSLADAADLLFTLCAEVDSDGLAAMLGERSLVEGDTSVKRSLLQALQSHEYLRGVSKKEPSPPPSHLRSGDIPF